MTGKSSRINWLNVITVVRAAILIGAEVFGAAFAMSWAIGVGGERPWFWSIDFFQRQGRAGRKNQGH